MVNVVSMRYYRPMLNTDTLLFELLERICRVARAEQRTQGLSEQLQPVHLQALVFLDRANRYSNTPQTLAEYLGSTKGTVSQSLLLLYRRGLVVRASDPQDGRLVRLNLSTEGRRLLDSVSLNEGWREALAGIPPEDIHTSAQVLGRALTNLQRSRGGRSFGVCRSCRHFQMQSDERFRCGLTGEPLSLDDSRKICREHEPPDESGLNSAGQA